MSEIKNNSGAVTDRFAGAGYVLCGGQSRRFGSDKARAVEDGQTLLERNVAQLQLVCQPVVAIADRPGKYRDLGIETLADVWPGCGPLGGLHKALTDARVRSHPEWIAVTTCDQTWLNPDWLHTLAALRGGPESESQLPTSAAINFRATDLANSAGKYLHPFPGIYHISLLELLDRAMEARVLSVQHFLNSLQQRLLTRELPADWPAVAQVNSPEEWQRWQASRRS